MTVRDAAFLLAQPFLTDEAFWECKRIILTAATHRLQNVFQAVTDRNAALEWPCLEAIAKRVIAEEKT